MAVVPVVAFRGLDVAGECRDWREVPFQEKLGLVLALRETDRDDIARGIAETIGFSRITAGFRKEIVALERAAAEV